MNEQEAKETARGYSIMELIARVDNINLENVIRLDVACAQELGRRMSDIQGLIGPQP